MSIHQLVLLTISCSSCVKNYISHIRIRWRICRHWHRKLNTIIVDLTDDLLPLGYVLARRGRYCFWTKRRGIDGEISNQLHSANNILHTLARCDQLIFGFEWQSGSLFSEEKYVKFHFQRDSSLITYLSSWRIFPWKSHCGINSAVLTWLNWKNTKPEVVSTFSYALTYIHFK